VGLKGILNFLTDWLLLLSLATSGSYLPPLPNQGCLAFFNKISQTEVLVSLQKQKKQLISEIKLGIGKGQMSYNIY